MPPSFSLRAKQEISREPFGNDCCMLSELAAFVRMAGTLEIASGGALSLRIDLNAVIAERIFRLIRDQYDVAAQIVPARCVGWDGVPGIRCGFPTARSPAGYWAKPAC